MSEWISVKDRLPEPETLVLSWDGKYIQIEYFGFFFGFEFGPATNDPVFTNKGYKITHWMPLPEPPK
jgi:hypothetical protein